VCPPKVSTERKLRIEVSVLALTCLLSTLLPLLSQANESPIAENDRRELLSYCYARQVYELKLVQANALDSKRSLAGMKESTRKEVERLVNELVGLNERRLGYVRGQLDANGIDTNSGSFRQKYDRLALEDLRSSVPTEQQQRCHIDCTGPMTMQTSPGSEKQFKICADKCMPVTVAVKRARACQALYVNLR